MRTIKIENTKYMKIKKMFEGNPDEKEMGRMMKKVGIRNYDYERLEYTLFNNAVRDFLIDRCGFAVKKEGGIAGSVYAYRIVSLETEFLKNKLKEMELKIDELEEKCKGK